jgi:hypothetical protein
VVAELLLELEAVVRGVQQVRSSNTRGKEHIAGLNENASLGR